MRDPLPEALGPRFSVAEARSLGVARGRLRGSDLEAPFPGTRRIRDLGSGSEYRDRCRDYLPRLHDDQFFSHETALALLGVALPEHPHRLRIHVSTHRPAREPRVRGIVGHRLQRREPATILTSDGLPVEHPLRAWRQCGLLWRLDDLIAAADHLLLPARRLAEVEDLRDEIRSMGDVRSGILRRALADARIGVESPRETKLRLAIVRARLPEPIPGWELRDPRGEFIARLDLAYPRWRVAPEYDGRQHAEDPKQFARDADRWEAIRRASWTLVRVLSHHLDGPRPVAVERVRSALLDAGWRPGMPS